MTGPQNKEVWEAAVDKWKWQQYYYRETVFLLNRVDRRAEKHYSNEQQSKLKTDIGLKPPPLSLLKFIILPPYTYTAVCGLHMPG